MPVVTPMEFLTIEDKKIIIVIPTTTTDYVYEVSSQVQIPTTDYVYEVSSQVQILLQLL